MFVVKPLWCADDRILLFGSLRRHITVYRSKSTASTRTKPLKAHEEGGISSPRTRPYPEYAPKKLSSSANARLWFRRHPFRPPISTPLPDRARVQYNGVQRPGRLPGVHHRNVTRCNRQPKDAHPPRDAQDRVD